MYLSYLVLWENFYVTLTVVDGQGWLDIQNLRGKKCSLEKTESILTALMPQILKHFYLSKYKNIFRENSHHILYFFLLKHFTDLLLPLSFVYTQILPHDNFNFLTYSASYSASVPSVSVLFCNLAFQTLIESSTSSWPDKVLSKCQPASAPVSRYQRVLSHFLPLLDSSLLFSFISLVTKNLIEYIYQ